MHELKTLFGSGLNLPTFNAESLAAEYVESQAGAPVSDPARTAPLSEPRRVGDRRSGATVATLDSTLATSSIPGVWQLNSSDKRVTALFREQTILAETEKFIGGERLSRYLKVSLIAPGKNPVEPPPFLIASAGDVLSNWQLAMHVNGSALTGSRLPSSSYMWTGVLAVLFLGLTAWASGRSVSRQMQSTQLKNDLLSTVSHELKTPLSSIRALVDTLLAGRCRDSRQLEDYLQLIAHENERLTRLIENFLSFNRLERGKHQFRFEKLDPSALAKEAVEAVRGRLYAPHAHFEISVEPNLPALHGDRDALLTALVNLLDNACKYTEQDKRISLAVSAENNGIKFAVQDNGIGISAGDLPRIFDRFYQSEQNGAHRQGGCGLGLSIVKLIVDAHGGTVDVQSKSGAGSTFCIRLRAASR